LGRWRDALYPPNDGRLSATVHPWRKLQSWPERRRRPRAISAAEPDATEQTVKALRRQGELWRAPLSGEKHGKDMLEIDNYLDAGKELAHRMAVIARRAVLRMPLLTLSTIALIGAGVWLLSQGSSSQLVAGATRWLAALGLTWKGLGGALGQLAGKLEEPLWGAVLDNAIADAITLPPDNKAETGGRRQVALAVAAGKQTDKATALPALIATLKYVRTRRTCIALCAYSPQGAGANGDRELSDAHMVNQDLRDHHLVRIAERGVRGKQNLLLAEVLGTVRPPIIQKEAPIQAMLLVTPRRSLQSEQTP
jgi:hypothetical protein